MGTVVQWRNFRLCPRKPMFEGLLPYLGGAVTARVFLAPGGIYHFGAFPPSPPLSSRGLKVGLLNLAMESGGALRAPLVGSGAKPQPPTNLLHFEDPEMLLICPSVPIPASTELTEFLYISCCKNYCTLFFWCPLFAGARGYNPPLPATIADELLQA